MDRLRLDHAGERREPLSVRIDVGGEPRLDFELRRDGLCRGNLGQHRPDAHGSASFGQLAFYGGTITGGTANSAGVAFSGYGGTLSGTTFVGPLNLTDYTSVHLANGATVVGSAGSGPGTINVAGANAYLYFDNTQTVSNETINLGNSSNYDYLYEYDTAEAGTQV